MKNVECADEEMFSSLEISTDLYVFAINLAFSKINTSFDFYVGFENCKLYRQ